LCINDYSYISYQIAQILPAYSEIHDVTHAPNEEKYASVTGEQEPPEAQLKWQPYKTQVSQREPQL